MEGKYGGRERKPTFARKKKREVRQQNKNPFLSSPFRQQKQIKEGGRSKGLHQFLTVDCRAKFVVDVWLGRFLSKKKKEERIVGRVEIEANWEWSVRWFGWNTAG
ncbi:hypothetical protein FRX31_013829 [Thalictrum thalictroides]|uniref:Uncharacterized protein n=1 Tax=Thalictrum thalictroides TaxID=46969 RepID=A0A7J6WI03_THATH|nr:hypothetical protein FRX31_013829 [Thalictrum thalictroides]